MMTTERSSGVSMAMVAAFALWSSTPCVSQSPDPSSTDDAIFSDKGIVTSFTPIDGLPITTNIYWSVSAKMEFAQSDAWQRDQLRQKVHQARFYVVPSLVIIPRSDLERAKQQATVNGKKALPIRLLPTEVRNAAQQALRAHFRIDDNAVAPAIALPPMTRIVMSFGSEQLALNATEQQSVLVTERTIDDLLDAKGTNLTGSLECEASHKGFKANWQMLAWKSLTSEVSTEQFEASGKDHMSDKSGRVGASIPIKAVNLDISTGAGFTRIERARLATVSWLRQRLHNVVLSASTWQELAIKPDADLLAADLQKVINIPESAADGVKVPESSWIQIPLPAEEDYSQRKAAFKKSLMDAGEDAAPAERVADALATATPEPTNKDAARKGLESAGLRFKLDFDYSETSRTYVIKFVKSSSLTINSSYEGRRMAALWEGQSSRFSGSIAVNDIVIQKAKWTSDAWEVESFTVTFFRKNSGGDADIDFHIGETVYGELDLQFSVAPGRKDLEATANMVVREAPEADSGKPTKLVKSIGPKDGEYPMRARLSNYLEVRLAAPEREGYRAVFSTRNFAKKDHDLWRDRDEKESKKTETADAATWRWWAHGRIDGTLHPCLTTFRVKMDGDGPDADNENVRFTLGWRVPFSGLVRREVRGYHLLPTRK